MIATKTPQNAAKNTATNTLRARRARGDMHGTARMLSVAFTLATLAGMTARAQGAPAPPRPYAEWRADVIDGTGTSVHGGVGVTIPAGTYVRVGLIGGIGPRWHSGDVSLSGRTDVIARFVLDPFRQMPIGLSLGGGVSVPYDRGEVVRPRLTAVLDIEGRRRRGLTPALQVGLGGGVRVGVALRHSPPRRR